MGYNVGMRVQMTEVYRDWISSLKDPMVRARVQVRVGRLVHGNPGKHRVLSDGVCELKVDFGPGYPGVLHGARRCFDRASCRWRQVLAAARHQNRSFVG